MGTITFTLRTDPKGRYDLSALKPVVVCGQPAGAIERLVLRPGREPVTVGDVFDVVMGTGEEADAIVIEGHPLFDRIGAGLSGGSIRVDGDCGARIGAGMTAGRLDIRGSVGELLASAQKGGLISVGGNAGDGVGAMEAGHRYGMLGGTVHVRGDIGARAGDRMRRGILVVGGRTGPHAGSRMMGGTLIAGRGFGTEPGPLMRRGTLIGPSVERWLPTFADCGRHELGILALLRGYLAESLGDLAPRIPAGPVRRFMGDLATIGKGEVLLVG